MPEGKATGSATDVRPALIPHSIAERIRPDTVSIILIDALQLAAERISRILLPRIALTSGVQAASIVLMPALSSNILCSSIAAALAAR